MGDRGGFLGAHLFSALFYFPREVADNPLVIFKLWEDISSFGGIMGGILGIWLFFRIKARESSRRSPGLPRRRCVRLSDRAHGRTGRLQPRPRSSWDRHDVPARREPESAEAREYITHVYADAGRIAELPGAARLSQLGFHDLGWYEFLYLAVVVVPIIFVLGRRPRRPGFFLAAFTLLYMPVRFLLDFLRVSDARYAGLTPAQWTASIALLLLPVFYVSARRTRPTDTPRLAGGIELM